MASLFQRGDLCPRDQDKITRLRESKGRRARLPSSQLCEACRRRPWWISYKKDGRIHCYSLRTRDETVAKYKRNQIENQLRAGDVPAAMRTANTSWTECLSLYRTLTSDTIGPQQLHEEGTHLRRLCAFLQNKPLGKVEDIDIKSFLGSLTKTVRKKIIPLSDRSKNSHLVTFKKFFKLLVKKGKIKVNPIIEIKTKKLPKNKPAFLQEDADLAIFKYAKKNAPEYYVMMALGRWNGLRVSEMLNLAWPEVEYSRPCAHCQGKGKIKKNLCQKCVGQGMEVGTLLVANKMNFKTKSRTCRLIPLAAKTEEALKKLKRRTAGYCLFPDDAHRSNYWRHRDELKRIARAAKHPLEKGKAFHILRHTFATRHMRDGRSVFKVADWLGHADVQTTKGYSHLDPTDREINKV